LLYFIHFKDNAKSGAPRTTEIYFAFSHLLNIYNIKHAPHTSLVQQLSKTVYTCSDWGGGDVSVSILNFCLFRFLHFVGENRTPERKFENATKSKTRSSNSTFGGYSVIFGLELSHRVSGLESGSAAPRRCVPCK
jgi:hypothetical protein